jgi:ATP-binding cassette subfamily F protein uup
MPLITLTDLSIAFGDNLLLNRASLSLYAGQKTGLIGRNGEGKSTLLKIIGSQISADAGDIRLDPGVRIAMLEQSPKVSSTASVFEYVALGLGETGSVLAEYQSLVTSSNLSDKQLNHLSDLQHKLDSSGGWSLQSTVDRTLSRLGLDGSISVAKLSGGWQRRASLARALVSAPDILLLDEPTNHLDVESIVWLEKQIIQFDGAIVFVTHDREFLQRVATNIVELDRGKLSSWPGTYGDYLSRKAAALEQEERQNAVFDKKLAKEETWIRQGIKARRTRNEGRVRALKKLRQEQSERRSRKGNVRLELEQSQQSGKRVIEATNISYKIAGQQIISSFSTRIIRGDRIGLIGPNGIGKTTLLRLLLKELVPDSGEIIHGTRIEVAYFDQLRSELDPNRTVVDTIGEGREEVTINGRSRHVISYLSDFLFSPDRSRSPIKALSGGERARVLLAKLFSKSANLLIMDEPTNDLDIETLELLEELLLQFDGTLLLVSHDRKFLDNVVTSTFSFEGNGIVKEYVGGYSDWLRQTRTSKSTENKKQKTKKENRQPQSARPAPTQETIPTAKKKLSYNLRRELDMLPDKIDKLEAEQRKLTLQMSRTDFYNQPEKTVKDVSSRLNNISAELEECFQRWAELDA